MSWKGYWVRFNYYDNRRSPKVSVEELIAKLEKEENQGSSMSESSLSKAKTEENVAEEEELPMGVTLDTDPIFFRFASASLTRESQEYIQKEIYTVLSKYPQINLDISGFTDSSGDDKLNLSLSKRRAKTIYDFLIRKGIDASRLSYQGFGESNPIASNQTPEGRAANRRVEFEITF